jgi:hypothetical protein
LKSLLAVQASRNEINREHRIGCVSARNELRRTESRKPGLQGSPRGTEIYRNLEQECPRSATGITVQNAFNVSDFALQGFDLLTAKINIADRNLRIGFQPGQKLPEADQVCIDGRLKHTSNDSGMPASEK